MNQSLVAFDRERALPGRVRGEVAFHLAIVRAAGNSLVGMILRAIQLSTVEALIRRLTEETVTTERLPWHQRILNGISLCEARRASDAMLAHLAVGPTGYGGDIDRPFKVITRRSIGRLVGGSVTLYQVHAVSGGA